jgi:hypothetical protein
MEEEGGKREGKKIVRSGMVRNGSEWLGMDWEAPVGL